MKGECKENYKSATNARSLGRGALSDQLAGDVNLELGLRATLDLSERQPQRLDPEGWTLHNKYGCEVGSDMEQVVSTPGRGGGRAGFRPIVSDL